MTDDPNTPRCRMQFTGTMTTTAPTKDAVIRQQSKLIDQLMINNQLQKNLIKGLQTEIAYLREALWGQGVDVAEEGEDDV